MPPPVRRDLPPHRERSYAFSFRVLALTNAELSVGSWLKSAAFRNISLALALSPLPS